jgi:hypothetical protein
MKPRALLSSLLSLAPLAAALAAAPAIKPERVIALFDGKDLSAFDTWLVGTQHADPDRVITVVDRVDDAPALRVSGERWGGFVTKESYRDYRLTFEFRWGLITWGERRDKARDSGVLLHCQGRFGNYTDDFKAPWMRSVEYNIIEGGTGDIILVRGFEQTGGKARSPWLVSPVAPVVGKAVPVFSPDGAPTRIPSGRVFWWGRDPQWKDTLGFRGPRDVERPVGQWNECAIECRGGAVRFWLNGQLVNAASDGDHREGLIFFQSEGAEIYYRKIFLHPLPPAADAKP